MLVFGQIIKSNSLNTPKLHALRVLGRYTCLATTRVVGGRWYTMVGPPTSLCIGRSTVEEVSQCFAASTLAKGAS